MEKIRRWASSLQDVLLQMGKQMKVGRCALASATPPWLPGRVGVRCALALSGIPDRLETRPKDV